MSAAQVSVLGLARMPLLAELPRDRLEAIAARCCWRRFDDGQALVARGTAGPDVHLVVQGRVRIHLHAADGREVLFTHVQEGAIVGDFAALDGGLRLADAHACGSVLSASLAGPAFRELLRQEPEVEARYVRYLLGLVRSLTERVVELSTLSVQDRIRAELVRQARSAGADGPARIAPVPRHADLAAQVGTTREQVTRELSALTRAGLLQKSRDALLLPDVARLVGGAPAHRATRAGR